MGSVNSTGNKLEKALASDLPEDERYFGLENFGNTCYCNSVLQALYFCEPFRKAVLDYADNRRLNNNPAIPPDNIDRTCNPPAPLSVTSFLSSSSSSSVQPANGNSTFRNAVKGVVALSGHAYSPAPNPPAASPPVAIPPTEIDRPLSDDDTMLTALADLFTYIATQKKRTGSVPPKAFVNKLRQENELFSTYMHQDAHEFLNFILNNVVECLNRENAERQRHRLPSAEPNDSVSPTSLSNPHTNPTQPNGISAQNGSLLVKQKPERDSVNQSKTFVHELFEGQLSNEVRCLCCETVTRRVESFFDLSVDVEQNSSLTACLRSFSSTELLEKQDKFFCDVCCSLQEAERRMRVNQLPRILALHLKRFKYVEQLGKYKKLSYRVVFPLELRLCNTSDDAEDPDRLYSLFAVVVHVGSGPNQGHYVSLIKSHGQWLLFDDDCVEPKDESEIQSVYGITQESTQSTEAGYILFYEQTAAATT